MTSSLARSSPDPLRKPWRRVFFVRALVARPVPEKSLKKRAFTTNIKKTKSGSVDIKRRENRNYLRNAVELNAVGEIFELSAVELDPVEQIFASQRRENIGSRGANICRFNPAPSPTLLYV